MKGYLFRDENVAENVAQRSKLKGKPLIKLVGAGRFELPTPSPPDWPCGHKALIFQQECFTRDLEATRIFPPFEKRAPPQTLSDPAPTSYVRLWSAWSAPRHAMP